MGNRSNRGRGRFPSDYRWYSTAEGAGRRIGLFVDDLLSQQQVDRKDVAVQRRLASHRQRRGLENSVLRGQRVAGAEQGAAGQRVHRYAVGPHTLLVELALHILELTAQNAAIRNRQHGARGQG